jgi:hypothetical protein
LSSPPFRIRSDAVTTKKSLCSGTVATTPVEKINETYFLIGDIVLLQQYNFNTNTTALQQIKTPHTSLAIDHGNRRCVQGTGDPVLFSLVIPRACAWR